MAFGTIFKRYEIKYIISEKQLEDLKRLMAEYTQPDQYGKTSVCNIYFDTEDFRLIRQSIEKPVYKEKLRLRSYGRATEDSVVFAELKKKYKGVVYKRRLALSISEAESWLYKRQPLKRPSHISEEIDYFFELYKGLHPVIFISCDREAYFCKKDRDIRITFDRNVSCRFTELSLTSQKEGLPVLPEGQVLCEVKCHGGIPLWLAEFFSEEKIYKTSFSKYGRAYTQYILPEIIKENKK